MRAVYFDLDGTLLRLSAPYRELLADAVEAVEGECRESWLETYGESFRAAFADCEPDPARRAFAAFSDRPGELAAALHRREVEAAETPPEARAALDSLADDHALGVLTNGPTEWQRAKLRENGLADRFDAVVTSYEAGAHKPASAPFALAERRLPADAHAMVGDSDADIEGAEAAGWDAVRYDGGPLSAVSVPWDGA